jgi:cytoskeleton protein RodZ
MFEIGRSLKEARERKQVSYSQVEEDIKVRSRYLRALEEEQFGVLPGPTYAKGFLRAYADYLGLDGQLYVDEFNSRHYDPRRDVDRDIYPRPNAKQRSRRRRESNLVMIVLAAIVAVSALVFLAFSSPNTTTELPIAPPETTASSDTTSGGGASTAGGGETGSQGEKQDTKQRQGGQANGFTVTITASGDCWITVHSGSPAGPAAVTVKGTSLDEYKLVAGVTATIKTKKPLFVTLGAPGSIEQVTIGGRAAELPYAPAASVLKITREGITPT